MIPETATLGSATGGGSVLLSALEGALRESLKTNITTLRDSGSYLFNGSNRTSYLGSQAGISRHGQAGARATKLNNVVNEFQSEQQKQKMMNAILNMNLHSQSDLILIFNSLQDPKKTFKVLCGCLALERFLYEEQRLENHQ